MERHSVSSSNIVAIGYENETQTLEIEFHGGRVYQYYGVPESMYDQLMQTSSKGKFFHMYIRNGYPYSRVP